MTASTVQTLLNVELVEIRHVSRVLSVFGRNRSVMSQDQADGIVAVRRVASSQTQASLNAKILTSARTRTNARHMKALIA